MTATGSYLKKIFINGILRKDQSLRVLLQKVDSRNVEPSARLTTLNGQLAEVSTVLAGQPPQRPLWNIDVLNVKHRNINVPNFVVRVSITI